MAFTAGNIIVYRIGGTSSAAAATFLDEYTPAGVLVSTTEVAFPTTTSGNQDELTDSGQATYSGEITQGPNGSVLAAGYDATVATASVSGTTVPRVVGIVSANGTIDTSTATTSFSGQRFTSAASADGRNIYVASGTGVGYTTDGATGAAVVLTTTTANQVLINNGQLYYSTPTATAGIYALGTGLPTTANQTSTLIAASAKPVAFAFATLGTGTTPDTLYVADNTNGIEKYSITGSPPYAMVGKVTLAGANGLSVSVTNGVATLYVTTNTGGVSSLQSITDSNGAGTAISGTATSLATAPSGSVFKGDVVYQAAVCFASGTRIRTARGDIAVEDLLVGDLAATASGELRPIRWLGHRSTECRNHPRPQDVMPIRVAAHAFGDSRPSRDLLVSPGHSICVDVLGEVLIPAGALVNDTTIRQVAVERITYWHVELESHDVILAEDLPCESYLEMGNRSFFADTGVVAMVASPDAPTATHGDFCRPFHGSGRLVEAAREHLAARAPAVGRRLESSSREPIHLWVDEVVASAAAA